MLTKNIEEQKIIDDIIKSCKTCFLGVVDDKGYPYVVPMNFGYDGKKLILHSGDEGGLLEAVKNNPYVCATFNGDNELIYQNEEVACSYRMKGNSVICRGTVTFEEDLEKKREYLNILMKQYVVDRQFNYSLPALKNVVVWVLNIEELSSRAFGVRHPYSQKYSAEDEMYF